MSFKALVMSPLHQTGASCFATMLAQSLTYENKTTTLAYTDVKSGIPKYLGVKDVDDPTRSIMQVVKLIDNNAIRDDGILDYTVQFSKNAHLLSFGDDTLSERDALQITGHIFRRVPTDVCILDNSDDIDSPVTKQLLDVANCVFLVISPCQKDFAHLHYWLTETQLQEVRHVYIVVNHYDPTIAAVREISKVIGLPANKVCTMHENPWIRKCCLLGQLQTLVPQVKGNDPRVINLSSDLRSYSQVISSIVLYDSELG